MGWLPWRNRAKSQHPIQVVMYTRAGCHLCDDAWQLLTELRERHGFDLESVDVDSSESLAKGFGDRVPVVVVNGRERFWGRVNRVLLERLLRAKP
jgi:glutaredoxin